MGSCLSCLQSKPEPTRSPRVQPKLNGSNHGIDEKFEESQDKRKSKSSSYKIKGKRHYDFKN